MIVPGRGNKNAKLVFIGEAPGPDEIRTGQPFRGESGKLLDTILGHNGISESEYYIDNVLQCLPRGRNPTFEEIKEAIPNLRARLRDLPNVNCLVPVGNIALQSLSVFQYSGLLSKNALYRGSILPARLLGGKKMVPILHPAYILKNGSSEWRYLHVSISDVARAKEQSNFPTIIRPVRNHRIIYNLDEAVHVLREMRNNFQWAFDVETSLPCLGFAPDGNNSYTIPFASERYPHIWPERERAFLIQELKKLFTKEARIITQNGFFDKRVLWKDYGIDPLSWEIYIDTMHLHQLLYSELPHSLAFLTSVYTEEPFYKDEGFNFRHGTNGELEYFTYNGKDCCVTYEIAMALWEELCEIPGQEEYYLKYLQPSYQTLFRMHKNGVWINDGNLMDSVRLLKRQETIERIKLLQCTGMEPNPRAPTEMEPFLRSIGIKEADLTRTPKTKQITLTEDLFGRLYSKYKLPALEVVLRLRSNLFTQSGFTGIETDNDGRYRIVFKLGPKSGRLAASGENKGPQLQNIPGVPAKEKLKTEPNLRSCYAAPPGRVLVAADLEQADARAFAYGIPEPTLVGVFESDNPNIHTLVASEIFGIPRDQISKHGNNADKYKVSKVSGHGTNYRMGPITLQRSCRDEGIFISVKDAKSFQSRYLARFNAIGIHHKQLEKQMRTTRALYDLCGRRHLFLGAINDKLFSEATSRMPQATVAGVMLRGMNLLQEAIDSYDWANEPLILIQVHDEIIVECDENDALLVAQLIKKTMTVVLQAHERSFSIPMEISIGPDWGNLCPMEEWLKRVGCQSTSYTPKKMKPQISSTSGAG